MRLIDADALWHRTFSCEDAADVRKEIETAPTVDAVEVVRTRWIPVTERLPDKYRETDEEHFGEPIEFIVHIKGAQCATVLCFDGAEFFDIYTEQRYEVTNWMPLPLPPKGRS